MTTQKQNDPKRESRRVLLVAVDAAVRDLARQALEGAGFTVLAADNAATALTLATNSDAPVDLLVTNLAMPGLSGPSLAAELTDRIPNLRVVYMSGPTDAVGRSFLYMPFNPAELLRRVQAAFKS